MNRIWEIENIATASVGFGPGRPVSLLPRFEYSQTIAPNRSLNRECGYIDGRRRKKPKSCTATRPSVVIAGSQTGGQRWGPFLAPPR